MDFWSRLIGGAGAQRNQAASNNPQHRLARFKKVHHQIQATWQRTRSLPDDANAAETLRVSFQRLTSILHEESRSPSPHLCLTFAASSQLYTQIASIGATSHNEGIIREGVAVFAALIDSEEEEFLSNGRFAQALMGFVGRIASSSVSVGEDTNSEVVELLFGIAAKIRLQPEILPVWFSLRGGRPDAEEVQKSADFAGVTQKEDFPLCYHLIDHVHHEGRIGDFARTGLLYIFESASKSPELEQWIVESDLATLMATGLGALYSQLSRELSILHPEAEMPIILTMSDYVELQASVEAESVHTPLLKSQAETFLSYLTFWQDVLEHCSSVDVKETLIDHFRVLFLQQLLYPTLLESSDTDGGSSVAVLTYLRYILDSLDHPELVHMILQYLLALPDTLPYTTPSTPKSPSVEKRRMSLMLLSQTDDDHQLSPSLFNLVDLIRHSIRSANPQTTIAALKLVTVIVSKNHYYALGTLLRVVKVHLREPQRTVGSLNTELEAYLSLAEDIGGEDGLDEAYDTHVKDMVRSIETHECSSRALAIGELGIPAGSIPTDRSNGSGPETVDTHHLNANDPLLTSLVYLLGTFFTNNVEINLALTETFVTLASCVHLRLEGWFAVEPSDYQFPSSSATNPDPSSTTTSSHIHSTSSTSDPSDPADPWRAVHLAQRPPIWSDTHTPPLLRTLRALAAQLATLRARVPHFDALVANRKQAFRVHDEIEDAMKAPPPLVVPSTSAASPALGSPSLRSGRDTPVGGAATPQRPGGVQRVLAGDVAAGPSRSSSPRGRATPTTPAGAGTAAKKVGAAGNGGIGSSRERRPRGLSPASDAGSSFGGSTLAETIRSGAEAAEQQQRGEVASIGRRIRFRVPMGGGVEQVVLGEESAEPDRTPVDSSRDETVIKASEEDDDVAVEAEVEVEAETEMRDCSLSHLLTNVVVLQEFMLELVALMQGRATLFTDREVRFA